MGKSETILFGIWLYLCAVKTVLSFMSKDAIAQSEIRFTQRLSPKYMTRLKDYEEFATIYMDRHARDYYSSGAGEQQTLRDNELAFKKFKIRPRLLRDVSHRNMSVYLLGQQVGVPFGFSPVAFQKMAHSDGEIGAAKAISSFGGVMILSMLSTTSMEELVRNTSPESVFWLQVYITKDREFTRSVVHRADIAGFKAIVVTVDSPVNGMFGVNMVHNLTLPSYLSLPNLHAKDVVQGSGANLRNKVAFSLLDPSLTWKDIQWIQTFTALPIVVKGVLTAEDAVLAVEHGASAILVSNHGGRQLDGVASTLDVLPEIVSAVKGRAEVYLDGGVRSGTDVFKALALGAKAVFVGRPIIWGLVHSGQEGVENILHLMKDQLDTTMALAGTSRIDDIHQSYIMKDDNYMFYRKDYFNRK